MPLMLSPAASYIDLAMEDYFTAQAVAIYRIPETPKNAFTEPVTSLHLGRRKPRTILIHGRKYLLVFQLLLYDRWTPQWFSLSLLSQPNIIVSCPQDRLGL